VHIEQQERQGQARFLQALQGESSLHLRPLLTIESKPTVDGNTYVQLPDETTIVRHNFWMSHRVRHGRVMVTHLELLGTRAAQYRPGLPIALHPMPAY
jgi:hypothetical protein